MAGFLAAAWVVRLLSAWQTSLKLALFPGIFMCFSKILSPKSCAWDHVQSGFRGCRPPNLVGLAAPEFSHKVKNLWFLAFKKNFPVSHLCPSPSVLSLSITEKEISFYVLFIFSSDIYAS